MLREIPRFCREMLSTPFNPGQPGGELRHARKSYLGLYSLQVSPP